MATAALKRFAKHWCPPAVLAIARNMMAAAGRSTRGRLIGPFANWEAAERASTTYASPVILDRVAAATAKILSGAAVYERDSVIFSEIEWPWPLLAALARQAACDDGQLRVLDFGGSLGSTGLLARKFLDPCISTTWHVVEQASYVAKAAELPFPAGFRFFDSIDAATASIAPNIVIASGVLHYLPRPFDTLAQLVALKADTLLIDRTPCMDGADDIITVQQVPATIFPASYPSWVFGRQRLTMAIAGSYREVARFHSEELLAFGSRPIAHDGWLFERKDRR